MPTSAIVRPASIQDLDQLVPLFDAYRQFYGRPADLPVAREFLAARFGHLQSVVLMAVAADAAAVGFVQLYPSFSSVWAARTYILNDLFVAPTARRDGVASQLLRAAADQASALGAIRLTLATALDNTAAQRLYESMGWMRDQVFCVYNLPLASVGRST